jgi:hypothetical protein
MEPTTAIKLTSNCRKAECENGRSHFFANAFIHQFEEEKQLPSFHRLTDLATEFLTSENTATNKKQAKRKFAFVFK